VADGVEVPASRLGYRITRKFVRTYLARIFDNPSKVFTDPILKPELQDPQSFADGILHIAEAHEKVARRYMADGGYELACPPLQAVLSIMAYGDYQGKSVTDPEVRSLFTRESLLSSDWYRRRLAAKKQRDIEIWRSFEERLSDYLSRKTPFAKELDLAERLRFATEQREAAEAPDYEDKLVGSLGADPMQPSMKDGTLANRLAKV
jgi:hypothetical protein